MTDFRTAKILCIDRDTAGLLALAGSSLRGDAQEGGCAFECFGAKDLETARDMLAKAHYDAVLVSWELCCEESRKALEGIVTGFSVTVVVVDDSGNADIAAQARAYGASGCITRKKLGDSESFRQYLDTLIHRHDSCAGTEKSILSGGDLFMEKVLKTCDTLLIIATDAQGNILYFNEGAEKILGYDSREMVGKKTIDILYPVDDPKSMMIVDDARRMVFVEKKVSAGAMAAVAKDGRRVWLNLHLTPRLDGRAEVVGMLGIGEDITEHKLAQERLAKSNDRYRLLLQLIPDVVYIIDPEGNFTFLSDSIKMLGYTPGELLGKHFKVIIHPEDYPNVARDQVLPRYQGLITGDAHSPKLFDERRSGKRMTTNLEVRLMTKGGGQNSSHIGIISAVNASGHYSHGGVDREFLGTIGVIRDITERKRAEEEHRRLQEQLSQAQKMEAIGRLAGGVAHDFNNMLSGIMGYAEVIKRRNRDADGRPKDAEMERFVDVIIKAAERAGDMTEKLLAFSRQGNYQLVPVNMHNVIIEIKSLLEHTLDKRIEIRERLHAQRSVVMGDPTQLQNVMLNLAMNARDAMPEGGVLAFETREMDIDEQFVESLSFRVEPGKYLLIQVSDTGVGMDEQIKHRLFEPFFTTKAVGKGVGLGLSSVYGTIKSHHGAILVDSIVGKGTTFKIYLPLHDEVAAKGTGEKEVIKRGKGQILVVDDEDIVRTILTQLLHELGYTVTTCAHGGEAINYFRQHNDKIDLVILDMNMPVMSGKDCLMELRKIKDGVKVIISTGYSLRPETRKNWATGVSGFVKKPFKLAELSEEIQRVLSEE